MISSTSTFVCRLAVGSTGQQPAICHNRLLVHHQSQTLWFEAMLGRSLSLKVGEHVDGVVAAVSRLRRHTTPIMHETSSTGAGQATNPTCACAAVKPAWRHNAGQQCLPDPNITFEHRPGHMQLPKVAAKCMPGRVQLRWWIGGGERDTLSSLQKCLRGMRHWNVGLYVFVFLDCQPRPYACFCTAFVTIPRPSDVGSRICLTGSIPGTC